MFKKGLILGIISFVAAVLLSLTYILTKPIIAQQELRSERENISAFLPHLDKIEKVEDGGKIYYKCYEQGRLIGYGLIVFATGYSSEIKAMVIIDKEKTIKGIKILEQQETPGLGSKIAEDCFAEQFKNKKAEELILGEKIEAISGATISSKAVVEAVKEEVERFIKQNPKPQ